VQDQRFVCLLRFPELRKIKDQYPIHKLYHSKAPII
jgi:hypothetical protein